jgi:hypothetical protein
VIEFFDEVFGPIEGERRDNLVRWVESMSARCHVSTHQTPWRPRELTDLFAGHGLVVFHPRPHEGTTDKAIVDHVLPRLLITHQPIPNLITYAHRSRSIMSDQPILLLHAREWRTTTGTEWTVDVHLDGENIGGGPMLTDHKYAWMLGAIQAMGERCGLDVRTLRSPLPTPQSTDMLANNSGGPCRCPKPGSSGWCNAVPTSACGCHCHPDAKDRRVALDLTRDSGPAWIDLAPKVDVS